ncbi:MAG: hypothetical protein ACYDAN_07495 [Candidatus Limnocylindrales bacterium]
MSAAGAWLVRALASLGGPQTAVAVLVAGVVAGGLGGYAITNSQRAGSTTANSVAVYPCPNQGPALLTIAGGQQLLVTGRLADSSWLRIHLPEPGRTEGWVQAGPLTVSGTVDSLPIVSCAAEAGAPPPAIVPVQPLTAILNATPSPAPTPTPSPTPSPSPTQNAHPSLTALTASTTKISYDQGSYCPTAVKKVTFSVKASDASGIASVALNWRAPGATRFTPAMMTRTAGTATSGTWQVTLDTTANGLTTAGNLNYFAFATDTAGATTQLPSPGSKIITVAICANTGPSITSVSSSSGSSLYWVPPGGTGSCQTTTYITAAVKDVDGLKAVTLYFRRPGSTTWSSKPLSQTGNKWSASLDTLRDKISIPNSPTGTLSWYIKAVDAKGLASQTKSSSITIRRCDSPAVIAVSASSAQLCIKRPTYFYANASDPDGLSASSATLIYTYTQADGTSKTVTVPMRYSDQTPSTFFWDYTMNAGTGWALAPVTWSVQTKDAFGGVTRSAVQKIMVAAGC